MSDVVEYEGEGALIEINDASMAIGLTRAEIDQQVATARAYPRSLKAVQARILSMATLDEESAEEAVYALPRGGKPIQGPSIRFAEILKQSYGNCRAAARVVSVDRREMYVEAEGVFHDLETNTATMARVRRRISNKNGKLLTEDMIIVTGNAACSIALRNAIMGGVPKPLWRKAYEQVLATIAGDVTTLSETREKAVRHFANYGVKPEEVFVALGVGGWEDITVDHVVVLRGMASAIKNGESTVEEMFYGTVKDRTIDKAPLSERLSANAAKSGEGFDIEHIKRETQNSAGTPAETGAADAAGHQPASGFHQSESSSASPFRADDGGGSAGGKSVEAAATNTPQQTPSHAEGDSAAAPETPPSGAAAGPFAFTADEARKYASWLARQSDVEKLTKASEHYFSEKGRSPEKGTAEHKLFGAIFVRNRDRAAGKIDAAGLLDEINEEIDALYAVDDFPGDR